MKKFLLPLALLFFLSACSSSDDPEPLNNTDNGGTTTDNNGGDDNGGWVHSTDTAYYFYSGTGYLSYDSLYRYGVHQLCAKLTDSLVVTGLGDKLFFKDDMAGNIIWQRILGFHDGGGDTYFDYLCDNQYSVICQGWYENWLSEILIEHRLYIINADNGDDIAYIDLPNDNEDNGYYADFYESIIRYDNSDYLLTTMGSNDDYYLIVDGITGEVKDSGYTYVDLKAISLGVIDFAQDGFVVSHRAELRAVKSDDTIIVVYIGDIYHSEAYDENVKLWANGEDDEFYPYNCEVESVEVAGTDIIYTLALATPPEDRGYPAYSKAVVTVSLETKSITEWEGIY